MKVGLFGNLNNNFFGLVRYLRDMGYDAELLFPDNTPDYFSPYADTYTLDYQGYCTEIPWNQRTFYSIGVQEISRILERYDALISCDYPAAFINKAGGRSDIYAPYGSDIYKYSYLKQKFSVYDRARNQLGHLWRGAPELDMSCGTVHKNLRDAIRRAGHVIFDDTNPEVEAKLQGLGLQGQRIRSPIPFLYAPEYDPATISARFDRSHWYREFQKVRDTFDIVVFHHGRHIWRTPLANEFSFKGTDKLIRGFAAFARDRRQPNACLVTMDYGLDVAVSKELIRELGIERQVRWFPKMFRKDIMIGLHLADIGTGEFDKSYVTFGTILEAMAMGKPIIHYRDESLYDEPGRTLYPLLNARSAADITTALCKYAADPGRYKQEGAVARQWFLDHAIDRPLQAIDKILSVKHDAGGRPTVAPAVMNTLTSIGR